MQKITGYKLSNGNIVENEEAIRLQKHLDFKKEILELCDKEGKYYVDDIEQLYNAIIDNHVELRVIFDKYQNIGYIKKSITI